MKKCYWTANVRTKGRRASQQECRGVDIRLLVSDIQLLQLENINTSFKLKYVFFSQDY